MKIETMTFPSSKNLKALNAYKAALKLTPEQHEVIVGLVLGDIYVRRIGKFSRLVFEQKNREYLFHLYNMFQDWTRTPPKERKQRRLSTSEVKSTWYFSTISHEEFQFYRDIFYPQGKKMIPMNIETLLSARALAYWYMDDGTLNKGYYSIATASFSLEEHEKLILSLMNRFDIEARISGKKRKYHGLYFPAGQNTKFKELVEPFIISSMRYKL